MNSIYANMTAIRQLTFSILTILLTWATADAQCPTASVLGVVHVDCTHPTGSIEFGATGGVPPYAFNIGGGAQASGLFTGLAPGTYTVTVTDVGNCTQTVTASATVQNLPDTQPPAFNQSPLPQNLSISCADPVPTAPTLTATDNRGDSIQTRLRKALAKVAGTLRSHQRKYG